MELEFRQMQIPFLQSVCHETVAREERGEAIVPDSMPDMQRIVCCCANAVLRNRECADGVVTLSGDIQACVLYQAAGEDEPRKLSVYLPFSVRRTVPDGSCRLAARCEVLRAEAQMLNSRKAAVCVTLLITLRVWQNREQICFRPGQTDRRVQMRFREYPMRLVLECAEKTVLLRDTLPLGAGMPDCAQILHAAGRCELTEQKLSGSQAACKGSLRLSLLFRTPEGALTGCELSMPFSQLIDLDGSYEEQGLELVSALTSLEAAAEGGGVSVEAGIVLQCIVTQTVSVPLVEDAYALRGSLRTKTAEVLLQPLLDTRALHQDCVLELPARAGEILLSEAMTDTPRIEWEENVCRIRVPIRTRVLYRDAGGGYHQADGGTEFIGELPAARSSCQAEAQIEGPIFAAPGAGRIEMRVPVTAHVRWYDDAPRHSISAAEFAEGPREERPAVIIRTLEADAPLWDIAKELRTTVSAIQIANDMDADVAPAGTMLLIPIVA